MDKKKEEAEPKQMELGSQKKEELLTKKKKPWSKKREGDMKKN